MAGKWFIEKFLVHGLIAAIALPMTVLSVSSIIDAQWSVVNSHFSLRTSFAAECTVSDCQFPLSVILNMAWLGFLNFVEREGLNLHGACTNLAWIWEVHQGVRNLAAFTCSLSADATCLRQEKRIKIAS